MTVRLVTISIMVLLMVSGCDNKLNETKTDIESKNKASQETVSNHDSNSIKSEPSSLPCIALQNIDIYFDSIKKYPKLFFLGDDNCVTSLIDSIGKLFIKSEKTKYLDVIAAMSEKSDGYVSEFIGATLYSIFSSRPRELCTYFYSNRNRHHARMLELFCYEVKMDENQKELLEVTSVKLSDKKMRDYIYDSYKKIIGDEK